MSDISPEQNERYEAAAFRRLVQHLRDNPEVQNIDLMNLAGFCRNCLANWYADAAAEDGLTIDKPAAREIIYGMPYETWRAENQAPASSEALRAFAENKPD